MTIKYRQGHLEATGRVSSKPATHLRGQYDVLILFPSWDERCLCVTECSETRATFGMIVLFGNRGTQGLRDEHEPVVEKYLAEHAEQRLPVEGDSEDLDQLWNGIRRHLLDVRKQIGQPLRIAIDLSTSRYYAAAVLAFALGEGIAECQEAQGN